MVIPSTTPGPTTPVQYTQTKPQPTRTFTQTPIPTQTSIPTKTPVPSQTPVPTTTPYPPYPTKQILFDYNVNGGLHSAFDSYLDWTYSNLVLYSDGQMIIAGEPYQQKILSAKEINRFFSQLNSLGFYTIESNQQHDPTDRLYNFGDQYQKTYDGPFYCILASGDRVRNLCAYGPYEQFLVPKMKNILKYLDEYHLDGMTVYSPDRILLWVRSGRSPRVENLPEEAIPWPDKFPSLETASSEILYVQGDTAQEISAFFDNANTFNLFGQNGFEYTVLNQIVLPQEQVTLP